MNTNQILQLGSDTQWGKIIAVGIIEGERYYWMLDKSGTISMMPDFMVEN